jgi:preprotein translocase subunit SecG
MGFLLTFVHVVVCLFLIVVVLLQSGKGADLAGAFGGMGSQTVFGPRGSATVLSRATTVAAALFMLTSLTLSIMATRTGGGTPSVLEKATKPGATKQQPAAVPQPGSTVPITVTPVEGGGKLGTPTQVQAPVVPLPPQGQQQAPAPTPEKK